MNINGMTIKGNEDVMFSLSETYFNKFYRNNKVYDIKKY